MNDILLDYYSISVVGIIKIAHDVYKVKTSDGLYVLKVTSSREIDKVYQYIEALHLQCFISIYLNRNNELLTPFEDRYLYLMPYVDISQGEFKEMKIKYYFETLAYLHKHSFYYTKVNHQYFDTLQKDIMLVINERVKYYDDMIQYFEKIDMRSPSQWMFVMNYYRIFESLKKSQEYLQMYMAETEAYTQIRVCMNYRHFDYDHISLKSQVLISLEHMKIDLPIYDLFYLYQRIPDILFDLDCFSEFYFKKIELKVDERLLLFSLMHVVPLIEFKDNEIDNIIKLSRLLYYLDSIQNFTAQLMK